MIVSDCLNVIRELRKQPQKEIYQEIRNKLTTQFIQIAQDYFHKECHHYAHLLAHKRPLITRKEMYRFQMQVTLKDIQQFSRLYFKPSSIYLLHAGKKDYRKAFTALL